MTKHPYLVYLEIVHPMSGHFRSTEMASHLCLLIWGVWLCHHTSPNQNATQVRRMRPVCCTSVESLAKSYPGGSFVLHVTFFSWNPFAGRPLDCIMDPPSRREKELKQYTHHPQSIGHVTFEAKA